MPVPRNASRSALERLVADVMAAHDAAARIDRAAIGGKHVLPAPIARRGRVFAFERRRQPYRAETRLQIGVVQTLRRSELPAHGRQQPVGKHRDAVLRARAVADDDRAPFEIDVLHPQPQAFHDSQSRTVKQPADQAMDAFQSVEERRHFGRREYDRQPHGRPRPRDAFEHWRLQREHVAIQEQQRALRLILRRRRDVARGGEVREEAHEVITAQFRRVAVAVETDKAFDPVDVRLLDAQAVMLEADDVPHPVEESWRRWGIAAVRF